MSTSALIGRRPIALQALLQPLRARAVLHAADQAAGEHRAGARGLPVELELDLDRAGEGCPSPASIGSGFSLPRPAAARSRAMPRTPRQSGRLGVTSISITGSSRPSAFAAAAADLGVGGQLDDAGMLVGELAARAPSSSMPFDTTPRIGLGPA